MSKLWSHRHPLIYKAAVFYHRAKRKAHWIVSRPKLARGYEHADRLPINVKRHSSRLIKKLGDSDMQLQLNKVTNLKLCLPYLDGLMIRPGETFSFCQTVGRPTIRRGFLPGMELSMGKAQEGIGGGICQMANMLHWLALHSPLTIVERSNHSFDPFPDNNRSIPFGTGCAIFYNYIDFILRNDTDQTFQLNLSIDDQSLHGQITSDSPTVHTYKIFEKDHRFIEQDGQYYRSNEIWRHVLSRHSGNVIHDEHIKSNFVRTCYTPSECIRLDQVG